MTAMPFRLNPPVTPCRGHAVAAALALAAAAWGAPPAAAQTPLPERVEIRRTAYGVPHILADDLEAVFYGLAWCHLEDYGERVLMGLVRARGELARHFGPDSLESDFAWRRSWHHAAATFERLDADTRAMFAGYAAGVNRYVELHPDEFPEWVRPEFTAIDVAARWAAEEIEPAVRRFLRAQERREEAEADSAGGAEDGSNAWALAPSRTTSGNAILLRNPHLSWDAGYYEAHLRVPGVIDFYGDFRVGYPLYFNGGFNPHLGWATTNNGPDIEEVYALAVDPEKPDHYLWDGASLPLERETLTVEFRNGPGLNTQTRESWRTVIGPVIRRANGKVYVVRSAEEGRFRYAEQFLRMMRAGSLEEWKQAMRIRAQVVSNFTYADREGNVFYVWNATIPRYPHPSGGDTTAVEAAGPADVWTELFPWDSLPQLRNPKGGYLHNENDPFHFTNLNEPFDPAEWPPYFPEPRLRLRSQHGVSLIEGDGTLSLEDVVERKHSLAMPFGERTRWDLTAAVRAAEADELAAIANQVARELAEEDDGDAEPVRVTADEILAAADLVDAWDGTVGADSRGAVLVKAWYYRYFDRLIDEDDARPFDERFNELFAQPWSFERPTTTPRGVADPDVAAKAFAGAVAELKHSFGGWDVAWGEVHRFRLGDLDLPANGCAGTFGCFRVVYWREADDGKQVAWSGDGWVLAVEFGEVPRAYSVLAYGQSGREDSPHHTDQLRRFADGDLKRVAWSEEEIARETVRSYRPGMERRAGAPPAAAGTDGSR